MYNRVQNVGEKPTIILYNYIVDRHAGTLDKTKTKDTISLDYSSICDIASRIVVAGVQLNFMWCGVVKIMSPTLSWQCLVFYKRIPLEPFVFLPREVGM